LNISEAFVIEHSIVDPINQIMTTVTKNLSHRKILLVEETQTFKIHPDNSNLHTEMISQVRIVSNTAWKSIQSRIEGFGLSKFKDNTKKSAEGLKYVLDRWKYSVSS
jgi:hypothetical protein